MPLRQLDGEIRGILAGVSTLNGSVSAVRSVNGALSNAGNRDGGASGIPRGGSPGDLLAKASNTDYDTTWVTPITVSVVDDILTFTEANT